MKKKNYNLENVFLANLARTFLTSLIIISFFFISPKVIEFTNERSLLSVDIKNNSKNSLSKLLKKRDIGLVVQERALFPHLTFDEQPSDAILLSAATIEELFKSTNYNLKDVRKNKLVKPISLTLLPNEIKKIENTKKRKNFFIQIILPLVIKENNNIKLDRKKLFSILNKSKNTKAEKTWLNSKFKQYGVGK